MSTTNSTPIYRREEHSRPLRQRSINLSFDAEQVAKLSRAAERRNINTLEMMAYRIMFVILRDNLIDAVLDDTTQNTKQSARPSA